MNTLLGIDFRTYLTNQTGLLGATGASGGTPNVVASNLGDPRTTTSGAQTGIQLQLYINGCAGATPLSVRIQMAGVTTLQQCYGPSSFGLTSFPSVVRVAVSSATGAGSERAGIRNLTVTTADTVAGSYPNWDGPGNATNNIIEGGSGIWNPGSAFAGNGNWAGAGGTTNTRWNSTDTAIFGGTAGTVTVDNTLGAVNINGLTFNTTGYTLSGGTLTGAAVTNTITTGSGISATVGSILAGGTNGFTKAGTGTLTLTGANTYTGATTLSGGTLKVGNGGTSGTITSSSAVSVAAGTTLSFDRSDADSVTGAISGAGPVNKFGAGTLTLTGANNYTGATTINGGTLRFGSVAAANGFNSPTTVASGAKLQFTGPGIQGTSASSTISLASGATLEHATTTTSAAHSFTVLNASAPVTVAGTTNINLNTTAAATVAGQGLYIDGGLVGTGTVTIGNTYAGSGVNLRNPNSTFTGTMIVNGAASATAFSGSGIAVGGAGTTLQNTDFTVNGTMELLNSGMGWANPQSPTFSMGALNGTGVMVGNSTTAGYANTVTMGVTNNAGTFSGVIVNGTNNTQSITKTGTGVQTLTGNNTYTGATTVSNGTLAFGSTGAASSFNSPTTVASGAKLLFNGPGAQNTGASSTVSLASGATLEHATTTSPNSWTVITPAVTVAGTTSIKLNTTAAATVGGQGLFIDGGLQGTGTVTVDNTYAGSGLNLRTSYNTFTGTLIVNGTANATPFSGSGIGVSGAYASLQNTDFTLNGTMELLNSGIGWANAQTPTFSMGALNGTGVMVGNTATAGYTHTVTMGVTNNPGNFSGVIANGTNNTQSITKVGTATQTLSGANTYTGATAVNAGTLSIGAGGTTGTNDTSSGISLASGTNLTFNRSDAYTASKVISGTGGTVTKLGAGTTSLTGLNTYTGATTITGGTLSVGNGGATGSIDASSGISIGTGANLTFNRTDTAYIGSKVISGLGTVTQAGTGTTTLTGANTYTGATSVNAGQLILSDPAAGNVSAFASPITIASGAKLSMQNANPANTVAFNNTGLTVALNAGGTLEDTGSKYVVVTGAVTNTGATTMNITGPAQPNSAGSAQGFYLDGGLKGSGTVTLGVTNPGNALNLRTGNNTFSGTMIVNGVASATAYAGSGISLGGTGTTMQNTDFTLNGTMELLTDGIGWSNAQSAATSIGALNGSGVVVGNTGTTFASTLTTGATNNPGTFSGVIANGTNNTLSLTKTGTGVQTLTGANTYTGTTTVSAGTLALGSPAAANSFNSTTTVASGAKFLFNGAGLQSTQPSSTISLASGATLEHATTTSAQSWTTVPAVTVAGTTTINVNTTAAATGSGQGLFIDGGLKGTGTVTVGNTYAGSGLNLRNANSTFTGTMIVNGTANATAFSGSGIGVGGAGTTLQNIDFTLNGTMELLNGGIGWTNNQSAGTSIGALNGTGVVVGNSSATYATTLTTGASNNPGTFSGVIANGVNNTLSISKVGTGTQTLSGTNTYTGGTTVSAGVLSIGAGGTSGSIDSSNGISLASGANLTFNRSDAYNASKVISGAGGTVTQLGAGTTSLTNLNIYSGATTITNGTLSIGNGGANGSINASSGISVGTGANLTFNLNGGYNATKVISGLGSVTQAGTGGTTTLTGANTYTGATTVTAGTLLVNGNQLSATGAVTVQTGGTLGGSGTLGGVVTVNSGGILSPGNSPGTITVSGLSLPAGSVLNMELGQAGAVAGTYNDLVQDNGNLSLGGGTLNISQSSGGNFTVGTYRLINYTGTLTNSGGLVIGTFPAGFTASQLVIDTSTAGQVNLIVLAAAATYWDVSPQNDGTVNGGTGTWLPSGSGSNSNWTDSLGATNSQWLAGGTATFQGTAGTVTVSGAPNIGGLAFNVNGYTLTGGTLNGTATTNTLTAGPGANIAATVGSVLAGSNVFSKTGLGTITLSGANTYTGATTVSAGTLVAGSSTALGTTAAGTTVASGATLALTGGITLGAETLKR